MAQFFENPEQFIAEVARQHDLAHAHHESEAHEVRRFLFDDLNKDQLVTLRRMMMNTGESAYGAHCVGVITTILQLKFSVCAACGKDHDVELLVASQEEKGYIEPELPFSEGEALTDEEYRHKLNEYNMREPYDGEVISTDGEMPVICKDCGMLYQSLEDRTKSPVGVKGCEGCQHKAKWG